ncbi:MAG: hypothetical protein ACLUQK_06855 [Clostridium sp.]
MNEWFEHIPTADMIAWRRHIHQHPELSFNEYKTSAFVEKTLRSFGDIEIQHPAQTSVLAIIRAQEGKISAACGYDALPMQEESAFSSTLTMLPHLRT